MYYVEWSLSHMLIFLKGIIKEQTRVSDSKKGNKSASLQCLSITLKHWLNEGHQGRVGYLHKLYRSKNHMVCKYSNVSISFGVNLLFLKSV